MRHGAAVVTAAYVLMLAGGGALALRAGPGAALAVSAPLLPGPAAVPAPPPWAFVRLPGGPGTAALAPLGAAAGFALQCLTQLLGGYGADAASAIGAVLPGLGGR